MDKLTTFVNTLEERVNFYAETDGEAAKLKDSLQKTFNIIRNGDTKLSEVEFPSRYGFTEGGLSQYRDLEQAYAQLSLLLKAGSEEQYDKNLLRIKTILGR